MSLDFIKFDADVKKEEGSLTLTAVVKRSNIFHPTFRRMISDYLKISKKLDAIDNPIEKLTFFNTVCLMHKKVDDPQKKTVPIVQSLKSVLPVLPKLTEEEVFEFGLPLPDEYEDAPQTKKIGSITIINNRDIGSGSNGTQVYQGLD